jgi:DNA primase
MPRPPDGHAAPGDARGHDDREQKLDALRTRVQAEADGIRTADDWARSLHAAALLRESFANSLLILAQRPDATLVKGYEDWRKTGRQVIRREPGIEIFSRAPGKTGPRSRRTGRDPGPEGDDRSWRDAIKVAYVWDISQTSGRPVAVRAPMPAAPGDAPYGLWDALCWLARRLGYAVEREQGARADGVTWWTVRRIRVPPGLDAAEAAWALTHQLGHVLLHGSGTYPPGATTSGGACLGSRKAEADAVAYIIGARHGAAITGRPGWPQTWAGTDPRAQPGAVILTSGERITAAAAQITQHLDHALHGQDISQPSPPQAHAAARTPQPVQHPQAAAVPAARLPAPQHADTPSRPPSPGVLRALADAERFYAGQLPGSWAAGYLRNRGIGQAAITRWQIGYAPAGWTTLTGHLRGVGHADRDIEAAGLARRSSHGTLIDHFRDRVMLPVHDEHGNLAGFTGRARPGAGDEVPKYLNSPQTAAYRKGELLFGWQQARTRLAAGAVPVIAEGPFDAIAVSLADPGRYAGLAPCGTALTSQQAALLGRTARPGSPIIVAFDDDPAGRKGAVHAHGILSKISSQLQSVTLSGRDPAQIMQDDGAPALTAVLGTELQPLSAVVIDSAISPWEHRLDETDGPLLAMRSAAAVIAGLLPADTATVIRRATAGRELATVDEQMRPIALPELPDIARRLPAGIACQIARVAERLGITDYSDVLAEVANAVTRQGPPEPMAGDRAPRLAGTSFPQPPQTAPGSNEPAASRLRRPGSHANRARTRR